MVKPWVMTGSSSVVRPFQQSSSMQRQPDRRTCLYISTEELPASCPATRAKYETTSALDPISCEIQQLSYFHIIPSIKEIQEIPYQSSHGLIHFKRERPTMKLNH